MVRSVKEPPMLWAIPFTLLLITLILAAADMFIPFIPINIGLGTWMWAVSTQIATIAASLVTEIVHVDNRRAILAMGSAAIFFSLIYKSLINVLQSSVVDAAKGAIPNSFVGVIMYTSILTVVPGVLTGVVLGGIIGRFPITHLTREKASISIAPEEPEYPPSLGYVKVCNRCRYHSPVDSKFCPFCGVGLTKLRAPTVQFCRFCGSKIQYFGHFCPDCGREIDVISKPHVFIDR